MILQGNCLEKLKELEPNSVDSIVTDPPYELGFMGKAWDNTGIANNKEMWAECLRLLKPGGYLLSFGGTRTYHRMAVAIEDAGFEVRDMIEWVYGSGFPKSYNVSKGIEGILTNGSASWNDFHKLNGELGEAKAQGSNGLVKLNTEQGNRPTKYASHGTLKLEPTTEQAKQWEGWGTALKPAHEPICMARKPLAEKTVAENVLKWGVGGINIDESRVGTEDTRQKTGGAIEGSGWGTKGGAIAGSDLGRFPANLIHDNSEEVRECFPEAKGGAYPKERGNSGIGFASGRLSGDQPAHQMGDSGKASRFFKSIIYQAKASKSERNKGCEELEEKKSELNSGGIGRKISVEKRLSDGDGVNAPKSFNTHPTVKPIALMEYLIKMVTPKGGIVLDPFAGSGSTLVAAKQNGFKYIGIELTPEYIPIIEARLNGVKDRLI